MFNCCMKSVAFVNDRQNFYILGLSFFKTNDSIKISNFIVRSKEEKDKVLEEEERLAKLKEFNIVSSRA